MTTAPARWMKYAKLDGIEKADAALATRYLPGDGVGVVRAATAGGFAVVHVVGTRAKWLITLPTLDRARAYLAALTR